jgi:hypothetical protein
MSGFMLGTRTIMNKGVNGSFEVIFSGNPIRSTGDNRTDCNLVVYQAVASRSTANRNVTRASPTAAVP